MVFISKSLPKILPYEISRTQIPWVIIMTLSVILIRGIHHYFFDYHQEKTWTQYFKGPLFIKASAIIISLIAGVGGVYIVIKAFNAIFVSYLSQLVSGKDMNPIFILLGKYSMPITTFLGMFIILLFIIIMVVIVFGSDYYFMRCSHQNIKITKLILLEGAKFGSFTCIFGGFVMLQTFFPILRTAFVAIPMIIIGFIGLVYIELLIYQRIYKELP